MKRLTLKRVFTVSLVFVTILIALTAHVFVVKADTEPNDNFDQAELITAGTYSGSLDHDTDMVDYYKIIVNSGQSIDVSVTPSATLRIYDLTLFGPSREEVVDSGFHLDVGALKDVSWTTNSEEASYTYYIKLEEGTQYTPPSTSGTYSMKVTLTDQNDANSGGDAGDTFDTSSKIGSANTTYSGFLNNYDKYDYYQLPIFGNQTVSVKVTPATDLRIYLHLYNPSREEVDYFHGDRGEIGTVSWTTNSEQSNHTYYILSERVALGLEITTNGAYSLEVTLTGPDAIPEFPTLITTIALFGILTSAMLFLKRRQKHYR